MKKLLLLFITITFAFSNVGKITALKGEVYIIRDSKQITAQTGSILILKDQIKTQNKARALVLFNDNTSITVGNNSTLSVNEFVMDFDNPKKSKTNFGFGKGIFRTITGKIGKVNPSGFKIKTKSASIGIRGTTLDTSVKILPNGTEEVIVAFIKGHGFITSDVEGIEIAVDTGENANMLQNGQHTLNKGALIETQKMNQDAKELKSASTKKKEKKKSSASDIETPDVESEVNSLTEDAKEDVNENIITSQANELDKTNELDKSNELDQTLNNITRHTMCPTSSLCASYESYNITDFGYRKDNTGTILSTYVNGTTTATTTVQEYIDLGQIGTYTGNIDGLKNGIDSIYGTISLEMDFGLQNFSGDININTDTWAADIEGSLDTEGFSSTSITSTGTNVISSGSVSGKFYDAGVGAEAVAGTIKLNSGSDQIIGAFGATGSITTP